MKSWIHELSESYVLSKKPVRRDLKEHYVQLSEEQRFELLSENVLVYLDEQLKNAYGIGVNDLNEEQLNELLGGLAALAGRAATGLQKAGKAVVGGVKKVASGLAKPIKSAMDTYAAGEVARHTEKAKQAEEVKDAPTLGGKLKAAIQPGRGTLAALKVGYGGSKEGEAEEGEAEALAAKPTGRAKKPTRRAKTPKPEC